MRSKHKYPNKEKLCTFLEAVEDEKYQDDSEEMEEASFSRQHYQAIADILSQHVEGESGDAISSVAADMADLFETDNPRFDRSKFMSAAGVKSEETEEEEPEDEEEIEEASPTSLDPASEKKIERLAALISKERKASGESETDDESLTLAARELLFGDPAKLNLKVAGDEEEPEEEEPEEVEDEE